RVRFVLSLGCACLVALFYFTDIMAVYPLLQILFKSQNPQKWIAEEIAKADAEVLALRLQGAEVAFVAPFALQGDLRNVLLRDHFEDVDKDYDRKSEELHRRERQFDMQTVQADRAGPAPKDPSTLVPMRQEVQVAKARLDELRNATALAK